MNSRRKVFSLLIASCSVMSLGSHSFAQESGARQDRPGSGFLRERFNENRPNAVSQEAPDDEEWKEISEFASQNMPNRWKMFEEIRAIRKDDARVVQNIKQRLAVRYRQLMRAKTNFPNLYDTLTEQAKKEDDVWGALQVYRNSKLDSDRAILQDKVRALVTNLLEERQKRIDQMRENLSEEETRLKEDRDRIDNLVTRRMDQIITNDKPLAEIIPPGAGPGRKNLDRNNDRPSTKPTDRREER